MLCTNVTDLHMFNINQSGEHCQKQYRCVVRPILSKQPSRVSCTLAEPSARARTLWSSDGCDHEDFNVRQSDVFFQPLLLVNFVVDRNEAYTAKSCLRCTRKSVSEFNLRYLNSIPKRVTVDLSLMAVEGPAARTRLTGRSRHADDTWLV